MELIDYKHLDLRRHRPYDSDTVDTYLKGLGDNKKRSNLSWDDISKLVNIFYETERNGEQCRSRYRTLVKHGVERYMSTHKMDDNIEHVLTKKQIKKLAIEKKAIEKKAIEKKAIEQKMAEQKTAEQKTAEQKTAEPRTIEPKVIEPKVIKSNTNEGSHEQSAKNFKKTKHRYSSKDINSFTPISKTPSINKEDKLPTENMVSFAKAISSTLGVELPKKFNYGNYGYFIGRFKQDYEAKISSNKSCETNRDKGFVFTSMDEDIKAHSFVNVCNDNNNKNNCEAHEKIAHWIANEDGVDICSNCREKSRPAFYNGKRIDYYCPNCGYHMIEMSTLDGFFWD